MSAYIDLVSMLGYTNNAKMMMETFHSSSNIILTDNPPYDLEMFAKAQLRVMEKKLQKEKNQFQHMFSIYLLEWLKHQLKKIDTKAIGNI